MKGLIIISISLLVLFARESFAANNPKWILRDYALERHNNTIEPVELRSGQCRMIYDAQCSDDCVYPPHQIWILARADWVAAILFEHKMVCIIDDFSINSGIDHTRFFYLAGAWVCRK